MSMTTIRKALEGQLASALEAEGIVVANYIEWPNSGFDDSEVNEKCRPTFHSNRERARTLGPAPRVEMRGFFKIGLFQRAGSGVDRFDTLEQIIRSAYPYGEQLDAVGGFKVEIESLLTGTVLLSQDKIWAYQPIDVYWNVWRST